MLGELQPLGHSPSRTSGLYVTFEVNSSFGVQDNGCTACCPCELGVKVCTFLT